MSAEQRTLSGNRRTILTIVGIIVLIGLLYVGFIAFFGRDQTEDVRLDYSLVSAQRNTLSATVNASGAIQAAEVINLNFSIGGTVDTVLVDIGDSVTQDAQLAALDTRELQLRVTQAESTLAQARARYDRLVAGATSEEAASAQAQLDQAQAQLRQIKGNVTDQDIIAAQAQLDQARANLAQLESGPKTTDVQVTQAQLDQARANLQSQRDSLSTAKNRAQSQMEQAANTLRDRQDEYGRIYWQNRELEDQLASFGRELPQENKDREAAALRAVESAEESLDQARLGYEQSRQAEVSGIAAAEAQVRSAEANLDKLLAEADADQLAAARAQLAQAESNLAKLSGDQRQGSVAVAAAGVANAKANLERVTASAREYDLVEALAQVQSAEAGIEQAKLALEQAILSAPITGTVAEVNLTEGEVFNAGQAAIVLADLSSFYVDVTVDEIDVAQLQTEQPVTLTLDALPDLALAGEVAAISPLSNQQSAVTSYQVRIEIPATDTRVRAGMSANADIVVAEKPNVLIVPRRAVRAEQGKFFVDIVADQTLCQADPATWPIQPELTAIEVTTGLSNEFAIEILTGDLDENSCLHIEGVDARLDPLSGPPPGVRNRN
ncbi:MAG: efflux RND transporter periplasmic adaptor subunit [Chloroflexales bacterium]|nr:efflux RND transporter periplasmic adaptor subunit [Chloroflexales bacterium]